MQAAEFEAERKRIIRPLRGKPTCRNKSRQEALRDAGVYKGSWDQQLLSGGCGTVSLIQKQQRDEAQLDRVQQALDDIHPTRALDDYGTEISLWERQSLSCYM